jgi:UDP-N-acetyl-D-mannosaminuronic acid dehydrogenase
MFSHDTVIVGLGYVGLPVLLLALDEGQRVCGVDNNTTMLNELRQGRSKTAEPEVQELLLRSFGSARLRLSPSVEPAKVYVVCVPTPTDERHRANLAAVEAALLTISHLLRSGQTVIIESTCPPGTTLKVALPILEKSGLRAGTDFALAYSPERILPGNTLNELRSNDRTVGGVTPECARVAANFYRQFISGTVHETDTLTAELSKLFENTFRDVNIALANEFANLSESIGANASEAIRNANFHPRVNILSPGPGVGGHCIAVDPWFLVECSPLETPLIATARKVNDLVPIQIARKVVDRLGPGARVAVLGLAYKANVSDSRESPSAQLALELSRLGISTSAFDAFVREDLLLPGVLRTASAAEALRGTDLAILATDHSDLLELQPECYFREMRSPRVLDTRNRLSPHAFAAGGVTLWTRGQRWH